jgi:hypothetical protein
LTIKTKLLNKTTTLKIYTITLSKIKNYSNIEKKKYETIIKAEQP